MERAFRRFPCSVMAVKAISSIGMPALLQDGGAVPVPIGGDMVVSRVVAMHACSRCPPTKKIKSVTWCQLTRLPASPATRRQLPQDKFSSLSDAAWRREALSTFGGYCSLHCGVGYLCFGVMHPSRRAAEHGEAGVQLPRAGGARPREPEHHQPAEAQDRPPARHPQLPQGQVPGV